MVQGILGAGSAEQHYVPHRVRDERGFTSAALARVSAHHAGDEPGPAPRRLDFLFQEDMRFLADISRPGIGPGPALIVGGTGGLAIFVALIALEFEIAVIAADSIDRGFDPGGARLDHAGAANARHAA